MAGCVDKINLVGGPIIGSIGHRDRMGFDGNASLPLKVHLIEHLLLHFPVGNGSGQLEQPVGNGRFSVVDVGNN